MIHIEEEDSRIEGVPHILLSEITIGLSHVIHSVSEKTGMSEADTLDNILEGLKLEKLLRTGMSYEEALDVFGLKREV